MKIGIDMYYAQSPTVYHGIGNYSFHYLSHLSEHDDVDVHLFQPKYDGLSKSMFRRQLRQFLDEDDVDVLLLPSPMQAPFPDVYADVPTRAVKVAVVYDLIPLVFPDVYLSSSGARARYQQQLEMLKKFDHLFAISEYTKWDFVRFGFQEDRITVIGTGPYEGFYRLPSVNLAEFGSRFPTQYPFVLAFVPSDFRKNAARLVRAFCLAVQDTPTPFQLVFVDTVNHDLDKHLRGIANEYHLADRIHFAGRVTNAELLHLYHAAHAVALPTLYEGLGLPAIEAMQCGCPLVTSNTSSLPEVVGDAAVLVNPYDVENIRSAFYRLMTDDAYRQELKHRALERTAALDWSRAVHQTVEVLERLRGTARTRVRRHSAASRGKTGWKVRLKPNRWVEKRGNQAGGAWTYFSFNLAEVPQGAKIRRAVLRVHVAGRAKQIPLHRVKRGWSEHGVQRHKIPATARRPLTLVKRTRVKQGVTVLKSPCTALAKNWQRRPLKNHGLCVRAALAKKPTLVITYS